MPWELDLPGVRLDETTATPDSPWTRAELLPTGTRVLLRLLPVHDDHREDVAAAVRRLGAVEHAHLLPVVEVRVVEHGVAVLALDPLGGSLAELVQRRGVLPDGEVVTTCAPIAQALAVLHDEDVLHGAIVPGEIWFSTDGLPMLAGAGLGRIEHGPEEPPPSRRSARAAFTAPEVMAGQPATAAGDVFALAAVARYAVTGHAPRVGEPGFHQRGGAANTLLAAAADVTRRPRAHVLANALFSLAPPRPVDLGIDPATLPEQRTGSESPEGGSPDADRVQPAGDSARAGAPADDVETTTLPAQHAEDDLLGLPARPVRSHRRGRGRRPGARHDAGSGSGAVSRGMPSAVVTGDLLGIPDQPSPAHRHAVTEPGHHGDAQEPGTPGTAGTPDTPDTEPVGRRGAAGRAPDAAPHGAGPEAEGDTDTDAQTDSDADTDARTDSDANSGTGTNRQADRDAADAAVADESAGLAPPAGSRSAAGGLTAADGVEGHGLEESLVEGRRAEGHQAQGHQAEGHQAEGTGVRPVLSEPGPEAATTHRGVPSYASAAEVAAYMRQGGQPAPDGADDGGRRRRRRDEEPSTSRDSGRIRTSESTTGGGIDGRAGSGHRSTGGRRPSIRVLAIGAAAVVLVGAGVVGGVQLWGGQDDLADVASENGTDTVLEPDAELCGGVQPAPSQAPPAVTDWTAALQALYDLRAEAYATMSADGLCQVYEPTSEALVQDVTVMQEWADAGVTVEGLSFEVVDATVRSEDPGRVVLEVTDRWGPYTLVDGDGEVIEEKGGEQPTTWDVELVPAADASGWRLS